MCTSSVLRWRTKQNLDFSFLMLYTQEKGTYYVQVGVKGHTLAVDHNMITYHTYIDDRLQSCCIGDADGEK